MCIDSISPSRREELVGARASARARISVRIFLRKRDNAKSALAACGPLARVQEETRLGWTAGVAVLSLSFARWLGEEVDEEEEEEEEVWVGGRRGQRAAAAAVLSLSLSLSLRQPTVRKRTASERERERERERTPAKNERERWTSERPTAAGSSSVRGYVYTSVHIRALCTYT